MSAFDNSLSPYTSKLSYGHGGDPNTVTILVNDKPYASHVWDGTDASLAAILQRHGFVLGAQLGHATNELYALAV